jgi:hypothetical protein
MVKCILHLERGRRPYQPAYPGKVVRESGCGRIGSGNQAGVRRPSNNRRVLFFWIQLNQGTRPA